MGWDLHPGSHSTWPHLAGLSLHVHIRQLCLEEEDTLLSKTALVSRTPNNFQAWLCPSQFDDMHT